MGTRTVGMGMLQVEMGATLWGWSGMDTGTIETVGDGKKFLPCASVYCALHKVTPVKIGS